MGRSLGGVAGFWKAFRSLTFGGRFCQERLCRCGLEARFGCRSTPFRGQRGSKFQRAQRTHGGASRPELPQEVARLWAQQNALIPRGAKNELRHKLARKAARKQGLGGSWPPALGILRLAFVCFFRRTGLENGLASRNLYKSFPCHLNGRRQRVEFLTKSKLFAIEGNMLTNASQAIANVERNGFLRAMRAFVGKRGQASFSFAYRPRAGWGVAHADGFLRLEN
ncbi:hypothetical protein ERJ75_000676700 [Trypanosoma vivax]|nr:hypothetical protein TRVL_09401 [Trypanosoma vivax]KAH8614550.1 hypothetical protein ERJ75_000676700 [Trypanosoma vivax]